MITVIVVAQYYQWRSQPKNLRRGEKFFLGGKMS